MTHRIAKAQFYQTDEDIVTLVQQFEACTLPKSNWNHTAHLTIAMWYVSMYSEAEAILSIRTGIQHYNHCNAIATTISSGYHETLTLFWITIARRFLASNPNTSVLALINNFILIYGEQKSIFREYYSERLIMSWEARQTWVAPDLKSFD